jgi:hypothetical protein
MKLSTDHAQWYDAIFDGRGPTFHRMAFTRGGLKKREQLALFDELGLATPPHGLVRELAGRSVPFGADPSIHRPELEVVVYEDELAHRGEGKRRIRLDEALAEQPDLYATMYVPPIDRAIVIRHVRIGRIGVWLRQVSARAEWRSNVSDDERVLARTHHREAPIVPRVLWAIDFVPSAFGLLAIDFNTAPELSTLGEEKTIGAHEIAGELEHAAEAHPTHLSQL